jgi:hypothetical protein
MLHYFINIFFFTLQCTVVVDILKKMKNNEYGLRIVMCLFKEKRIAVACKKDVERICFLIYFFYSSVDVLKEKIYRELHFYIVKFLA